MAEAETYDEVRRQGATGPILTALGLAVLVVISATSIWLVVRSQADIALVAHSIDVQKRLAQIESMIQAAENRAQAYLVTGNPAFLESFRETVGTWPAISTDFRAEIAGNPAQQERHREVESLVTQAIDDLNQSIRLREQGDDVAMQSLARSGPGGKRMEGIHASLDQMMREEQNLLQVRRTDSDRASIGLLVVTLVGTTLIVGLAGFSVTSVRRSNRESEAALRSSRQINAGLEAAIAERTAHLNEANAEIQRTLDVLNNTIASMAEAILVCDEAGRVVLSNPAAERLFGRQDLGSPDWAESLQRFAPDGETRLPFSEAPVNRAIRGEHVDEAAFILQPDGSTQRFHLLATGRPLRNPSGNLTGAVVVYRDVTLALETERQLRQSQKMDAIGRLTGGFAHDFNNILTVITGTIDILAQAVAHDPMLATVARMIDEAAERAAGLTHRLLAFARRQPLQPRETDINELIDNAVNLLRPAVGQQIEVRSILGPDAWSALVDPSQLTTAVLNLAFNARDAMPNGGSLTIETGNVVLDGDDTGINKGVAPGPYVLITLSDTGSGIPKAIREKVFEPFFTTKEMGSGTGLGLSMVYGFVKQSGGHIKLDSEEGVGTSIRIYLPRATHDALPLSDAAPCEAMQGGTETILVAEDDTLVRGHVATQLTSLGYKVLTAADAAQALDILDHDVDIDLLFTDVVMPGGMNGRKLAEEALKRRPAVKVLYTSGYAESALVHDGRLDAGLQLLVKPYRKSDLARMIRVALGVATTAAPIQISPIL